MRARTEALLGGKRVHPAEPRNSIVRRSLMVMKRLGLVLPGVLFTVLASACSGEEPVASSPVNYRSDDPSVYPLALMRGSLTLREGCLMLGEDVLVWPAGTAWESDTASVTFGGSSMACPASRSAIECHSAEAFSAVVPTCATS